MSPYFARISWMFFSFSIGLSVQVEYTIDHHDLHALTAEMSNICCVRAILSTVDCFRRLNAESDLNPVHSPLQGASSNIASKSSG